MLLCVFRTHYSIFRYHYFLPTLIPTPPHPPSQIPNHLDGTKMVRIDSSRFGTFKRLKIMQTTQQLGSSCRYLNFFFFFSFFFLPFSPLFYLSFLYYYSYFRVKFVLKVFINGHQETVPSCFCVSSTIDVFSHTLYLNGGKGFFSLFLLFSLPLFSFFLTTTNNNNRKTRPSPSNNWGSPNRGKGWETMYHFWT